MPSNVPDDWGNYWRKCRFCGGRYHMSEGGCPCEDERDEREEREEDDEA